MRELMSYERDAYLTELEVRVLAAGEEQGRPYALLDDTILYPEGGGQPADRGTLDHVQVLDVQKASDGLRHFLSAPVQPGPARLRLDWARRFDHMQQHTGQHLLTAVAQDRFGWSTTAFHLGERVSDIELSAPHLSSEDLEILEEAVAHEIRAARTVRAFRVDMEEYSAMQVRSRGLPEGHSGDVRLVEIQGVDLNTCGGTHLRSTSELEALCLLGTESLRGGTRVFYAAGQRARRRMAAHERRGAALRTLLGTPDDSLVEVLETKLEQLKRAERQIRHLEEELADVSAQALAARPEEMAERHFEGRDPAFLQRVAKQLLAAEPTRACFLTATRQGQHCFLLAKGDKSTLDVAAAGRAVASALDGKGGGSSAFFQGRAGSLEHREVAVSLLREASGKMG